MKYVKQFSIILGISFLAELLEILIPLPIAASVYGLVIMLVGLITAMASEILPGKTILEALNTDLVCDAINTAMRELFLQIVYGRTQTAFSEGGLPIGAGLEDLGKGLRSQVGTMYGTLEKGPRYLELAEGYVTRIALDAEDRIIGYEFVHLGKMMEMITEKRYSCTGSFRKKQKVLMDVLLTLQDTQILVKNNTRKQEGMKINGIV